MEKIDFVVTRHPGLVDYLRELDMLSQDCVVLDHATPDDVRGKNVCGVLPHNLSCLCRTFTEIPLNLPPELRGKELDVEQVRQYAGNPVTYRIFTDDQWSSAMNAVADAAFNDGCSAPIDWDWTIDQTKGRP